jgi:hypothetical protein
VKDVEQNTMDLLELEGSVQERVLIRATEKENAKCCSRRCTGQLVGKRKNIS